ncbi:MAG: T9SS type A sorting domain-containing protein [Bacteroidia bacterium]|nr:T9SS type A sorting domain-containing protein [Bacteroidia bacterium]
MKKTYALPGLLILLGYAVVQAPASSVIEQRIMNPILSVTPKSGEFNGVEVGAIATINFTIKNSGNSVLKIKKLEITGSSFTLNDTTEYPFEVIADTGSAFPWGNSGKSLKFSVDFKPADIGVQTGKVIITYGMYSDEIYEIPLTGEGVSCYMAEVAKKGENRAPRLDIWYKYTADKFSSVEVTSCHQNQVNSGTDPSRRLYFFVYDGCGGRFIFHVDEWIGNCPFDREAEPPVQLVMNAGQTIYIFWPLVYRQSPYATNGFWFNINVTYPVDGDVCENAIPLTLPVVNMFGNTRGLNDDYTYSPCSPFNKYMDGNDIVYTIALAQDGYLTGNIIGAYASIHVLDACPNVELAKYHCKAFASGPQGGQFQRKVAAGNYYVIISNWAPPQTVDFLLNLSWEDNSAVENGALMSILNVYPNPAHDQFTVAFNTDSPTDLALELVNGSGQVVYRKAIKIVYSFNDQIDASRFARGVYYIKANSSKEVKIRKVVIN